MTPPPIPPLLGDQRFKLALFGFNIQGGLSMTTAEGANVPDWPTNVRLAQLADEAGVEAIIPVCRWKGFGGPSNFHGSNFETFTWAAGLGALTRYTTVVATSHVPSLHPIIAAKQAATLDHITGGRFALNLVAGWFADELELFGVKVRDHEGRYAQAAEWIEVIKRLWTVKGEFDHEGTVYTLHGAAAEPKPLQQPHPPIISAAASATGRRFCARHADVQFNITDDMTTAREQVQHIRQLAWEESRKQIPILSCVTVTCRPTEREAQDFWRYCVVEKGDQEALDNFLRLRTRDAGARDTGLLNRERLIAGEGSPQVIGTPEQVTEYFLRMSEAGLDGTAIAFFDYDEGMHYFAQEVMPLMVQAGLRREHQPEVIGHS